MDAYHADQQRRQALEKQKKDAEKAINALGGLKPYEEFTFEKFRRDENPAGFDKSSAFNPARDNLYLYGRNRLGKTHLATAIARKHLERGLSALVIAWPDLVTDLRKFESAGDFDGEERYINRLASLDVLVIDDLGLGAATEYVVKILWQILTRRMNRRKNGLVITSNLTLNDLNVKYGKKIPSRIFEITGEENLILFFEQKRGTGLKTAVNFE